MVLTSRLKFRKFGILIGEISNSRHHHLVKTILIPQVAELIMKNKCLSGDDSMGLYGQSALYLYRFIEGN